MKSYVYLLAASLLWLLALSNSVAAGLMFALGHSGPGLFTYGTALVAYLMGYVYAALARCEWVANRKVSVKLTDKTPQ